MFDSELVGTGFRLVVSDCIPRCELHSVIGQLPSWIDWFGSEYTLASIPLASVPLASVRESVAVF